MLISATHLNSGVLQQRVLAADPAANPVEVTALLRWGKAEPGKHAGCGVSDECLELQPPWGFLAHKAPTSASPEPLHSRAPPWHTHTHAPTQWLCSTCERGRAEHPPPATRPLCCITKASCWHFTRSVSTARAGFRNSKL